MQHRWARPRPCIALVLTRASTETLLKSRSRSQEVLEPPPKKIAAYSFSSTRAQPSQPQLRLVGLPSRCLWLGAIAFTSVFKPPLHRGKLCCTGFVAMQVCHRACELDPRQSRQD